MSLDTARLFAIAKVGWIRQQQGKLNQQDRKVLRLEAALLLKMLQKK